MDQKAWHHLATMTSCAVLYCANSTMERESLETRAFWQVRSTYPTYEGPITELNRLIEIYTTILLQPALLQEAEEEDRRSRMFGGNPLALGYPQPFSFIIQDHILKKGKNKCSTDGSLSTKGNDVNINDEEEKEEGKSEEMILKDNRQTCSVCLEQISDRHLVLAFSCNHFHHAACLSRWVVNQFDCPVCRCSVVHAP